MMREQQRAKELASRRRVAQVDSNESLGCLFCSSFTRVLHVRKATRRARDLRAVRDGRNEDADEDGEDAYDDEELY